MFKDFKEILSWTATICEIREREKRRKGRRGRQNDCEENSMSLMSPPRPDILPLTSPSALGREINTEREEKEKKKRE